MPLHYLLLLGTACFSAAASKIQLPKPSGQYNVSVTSTKLVDDSRIDPFSPDNSERALMVSSFAPMICDNTEYVQYMQPAVAVANDAQFASIGIQKGTFESFQIQSCSESHPIIRNFPLMIFSPGLGISRLLYQATLQDVASHGYVVVSVDHPYDTNMVEFPDGKVIKGEPEKIASNPDLMRQAFETRVADLGFVLDELQKPDQHVVPRSLSGKINFDHISAAGHSFGGAATAQAMYNNPQYAGGINLDGVMFGSVVSEGFNQPFLEFSSTTTSQERNNTWTEFLSSLAGWKRELLLKDSKHDTFTDLPLLFDNVPNAEQIRSKAQTLIGSLAGERVRTIISSYVGTTVEFYASGQQQPLLNGPSNKYPEVEYMVY
ncbi:hypothetical protein N7499_004282 [Penicillium canescens]|nr:hypothetical protein N7499_004282 [Penicillium canescens]KAJ6181394.1 hypothetical protein N7485_000036 [Penicillium canescens]